MATTETEPKKNKFSPWTDAERREMARWMLKGLNQTEAYRKARKIKAPILNHRVQACHMAKSPRFIEIYEELKERVLDKIAKDVAVTVEQLTREAEEARALAMKEAKPEAAVSAIKTKAQLHGLWVDKREEESKVSWSVSDEPTEDEWEAEHAQGPVEPTGGTTGRVH